MNFVKKINKEKLISKIPSHCGNCMEPCIIFSNCSKEILDVVSYSKKCVMFIKGQRILLEDTLSNGIYFINSGKVKIYKTNKEGREVIVHLAKKGETIGFGSFQLNKSGLMSGQLSEVSAMAIEDTLACYLNFNTFATLLAKHSELAVNLFQYAITLLTETEKRLLKFARMNIHSRVADALVTLHGVYSSTSDVQPAQLSKHSKTSTDGISATCFSLCREDIANLAGTTKEQVSKALSEFKSLGIIRTNGREVEILDFKELETLSNG